LYPVPGRAAIAGRHMERVKNDIATLTNDWPMIGVNQTRTNVVNRR